MWSLEYVQQPDESALAAASGQETEASTVEQAASGEKESMDRHSSSDQLQSFRDDFSAEALRQRLVMVSVLEFCSITFAFAFRITMITDKEMRQRRLDLVWRLVQLNSVRTVDSGLQRLLDPRAETTKARYSWPLLRLLLPLAWLLQLRMVTTRRRSSCGLRLYHETSESKARRIHSFLSTRTAWQL